MPKERPIDPVTITLRDQRERTLRYPLGRLKAAKKEFGASLLRGGGLADLDEETLPKLLWYGLVSDDPGITPEQIENMVEAADLPYVMEKFAEAFTGVKPKPDDAKNATSQSAAA